jgi:hypothetical protein
VMRFAYADPPYPGQSKRLYGEHADYAGHVGEPSQSTLDQYRAGIIELFRASFSEEPARVGVAVLPWVGELDDDEREEAA